MGCTPRAYGCGGVGHGRGVALISTSVATVPADLTFQPLGGEPRTAAEQLNLFQLVLVAIDPYTNQSAWVLETAGRILTEFAGADCRVAWLVTAPEEDARTFLGPWAERMMVFVDPERTVVKALDLNEIPSLIHIGHDLSVIGKADGWDPATWRAITDNLGAMMSWTRPTYPRPGDPVAFAGSPAAG